MVLINMFESGLLVLKASAIRLAGVSTLLRKCSEVVRSDLYVHLVDAAVNTRNNLGMSSVPYSKSVQDFIDEFYKRSANGFNFSNLNFLVFNVNNDLKSPSKYSFNKTYQVVLTDLDEAIFEELQKYLFKYFPKDSGKGKESLPMLHLSLSDNKTDNSFDYQDKPLSPGQGNINFSGTSNSLLPQYGTVCLGGTFDRLHVGHKILLNKAALLTKEKLIVGVTNGDMNKKKVLHELMERTEDRMASVSDFLRDTKQDITYEVVPIDDPFGPSIHEAAIDAIVVSEETVRGADMINEIRSEKGFKPLAMEVINLVCNADASIDDEKKVSSSTFRKNLLGTLLRKPEAKDLCDRPYLIGLTGGIASGKTSIGKRLEGLGAAVINCDLLGHRAYEPGSETFKKVVATFGSDVIHESGIIDRRKLGGIVFKDRERLQQLNSIVWPAIADLIPQCVNEFAEQGKTVVVLDAAVLLEAGWDRGVHEVWTAIISPEEAEQRIMNRNQLSREQAHERTESQMNNEERVSRSNVVLCTLWDTSFTQKQVEKAWKLLQERLLH